MHLLPTLAFMLLISYTANKTSIFTLFTPPLSLEMTCFNPKQYLYLCGEIITLFSRQVQDFYNCAVHLANIKNYFSFKFLKKDVHQKQLKAFHSADNINIKRIFCSVVSFNDSKNPEQKSE